MKKLYRKPNAKSVKISTEDIMDIVLNPTSQENDNAKRQGNTVFDDLFDKVEGPSDMTTVEENDYSTHTTIE